MPHVVGLIFSLKWIFITSRIIFGFLILQSGVLYILVRDFTFFEGNFHSNIRKFYWFFFFEQEKLLVPWIEDAVVRRVSWTRFEFRDVLLYTHNLRNSMNERTHFFIKICISHTLFSKGFMFLWCMRDGWRQGQTAILTQLLFLTIARCVIFKNPLSTSPHLGWCCLTGGRWGPQPLFCKLALTVAFLSNSIAASTCLYSFITPTFFRFFRSFTQVHLWLTARSRVNI